MLPYWKIRRVVGLLRIEVLDFDPSEVMANRLEKVVTLQTPGEPHSLNTRVRADGTRDLLVSDSSDAAVLKIAVIAAGET